MDLNDIENWIVVKGLCLCFRCNQHVVSERRAGGGDAKQRLERGVARAAAVEAEDELVKVGLEVPAAQAMVDAQRPDLDVRKDPVAPGQNNVGGHLADDMGIMAHAGSAGIS